MVDFLCNSCENGNPESISTKREQYLLQEFAKEVGGTVQYAEPGRLSWLLVYDHVLRERCSAGLSLKNQSIFIHLLGYYDRIP